MILLTTINAKYHHTSLGLRYLYANLKDLQPLAKIQEFTLIQNPRDVAEAILSHKPKIVGFGVYIWNTTHILDVVSILKKVNPEIIIVLGGPEVSYEAQSQPLCQLADYIIQGEADFLFYELATSYLAHQKLPNTKYIKGELPEINKIESPYKFYTDDDIKHRYIYVEASRGCPFKCEYCLSSLDKLVRPFPLDPFLKDLDLLIERGVRQFKFLDRTFNLSISTCKKILTFFLERMKFGLFLHFEMIPDRLPEELRELITKFPAGSLQFEVGIQTWNPEVATNVSRKQNYEVLKNNFKFLTENTGVHIHADLIVGLPGETLESFAHGFDEVLKLNAHEIQVSLLKRLKGTPIARHEQPWQMIYEDAPPFQILHTKNMNFDVLQEMKWFSYFWNLYGNLGNFNNTLKFLKQYATASAPYSFFWFFFKFSKFLRIRHPQGYGVALLSLTESAWIYMTQHLNIHADEARQYLLMDYSLKKNREIPAFLKGSLPVVTPFKDVPDANQHLPKRQKNFLPPHKIH